jgi:hypothetical protein
MAKPAGSGRVQQPGGEFFRCPGRHHVRGRPGDEFGQRPATGLPQPERYRPAAGVVGEDHKEAMGKEHAVPEIARLGLGMRDTDFCHTR